MYKKILVPLDGSPLAEVVLPHAEALATLAGGEIILLRVLVDPGVEFSYTDPGLAVSIIDEFEAQARGYMDKLAARLRQGGYRVSVLIREGPVAETILNVARETKADLIAMTTHGLSGVQRWLLGSVADRVVNHASVPVILIRVQPE